MTARGEMRHYGKRERKYTSEDVVYWRQLMKHNNWSMKDVSDHLRIPYQMVQGTIIADNYGEL